MANIDEFPGLTDYDSYENDWRLNEYMMGRLSRKGPSPNDARDYDLAKHPSLRNRSPEMVAFFDTMTSLGYTTLGQLADAFRRKEIPEEYARMGLLSQEKNELLPPIVRYAILDTYYSKKNAYQGFLAAPALRKELPQSSGIADTYSICCDMPSEDRAIAKSAMPNLYYVVKSLSRFRSYAGPGTHYELYADQN